MTTVEALADMTPEQLEAIEGIGPKTVEKISLAVNNYFAGLEQGAPAEGAVEGENQEAAAGEVAAQEHPVAAEPVPGSEDITAEIPAVTDEISADSLPAAAPQARPEDHTEQAGSSEEHSAAEAESASETRE